MIDFDTIYNKNVDYLLAMCFQRHIREQDAEDIVSAVFIALWRNGERIIPGKEKAWLTIVLCNKIRDFRRREKTRTRNIAPEIDLDFLDIPYDESYADKEYVFKLLLSAVEKLNKRPRRILQLYLSGCQTGEIARMFNTNKQTVYNQKNRAINVLRTYLQPHL